MVYGQIQEYYCEYCKHRFNAVAKATGGGTDNLGRNIACQSNQIRCPRCSNFLPTWKDKVDRDYLRETHKGEK